MTAEVTVELLPLDRAPALHDAWTELAARCLEPSIFAEAGFVLPAARSLSGRAEPVVLAAWLGGQGGRLIGIAPIARPIVGRIGPARIWTHPQAVAAIPMLDGQRADVAWRAMTAAVAAMPGRPAALLVGGLDVDGPTARLIAGGGPVFEMLDERSRAVLRPGASAPGLGSKPRKELRRQWNRMADQGALSFATASAPDAVAAALDRFLRLEAKGWKGSRGTALGSRAASKAFVQSAVTDLARRGQVRVVSLDLCGEPVAMGVVLRSRDRAFFWKTAYDETHARYSPGLQLTLWLTEQLGADDSLTLVDSCAVPGHSMIDRLWPDRITVADILVATGQSRTGAFDWASRAETLQRSLRRRAKGLRDRWANRTGSAVP